VVLINGKPVKTDQRDGVAGKRIGLEEGAHGIGMQAGQLPLDLGDERAIGRRLCPLAAPDAQGRRHGIAKAAELLCGVRKGEAMRRSSRRSPSVATRATSMPSRLAPLISPITVITLCKPLSFPCNSRLNLIQAR
jgi:hypothetical protein